jgi:hypothetical protein
VFGDKVEVELSNISDEKAREEIIDTAEHVKSAESA